MTETITIHPATRIEGHARVSIQVDEAGAVQSARLHVLEFRGFEKFCEGRPYSEMPALMSRICGICPVSHILASAKACDQLLGVEIPPAAALQRRLMACAQLVQSHALSFFHLSAPDLMMGLDAAPATRNFFGWAGTGDELALVGIQLRKYGLRIVEMLGGKRVHPAWGAPGGVREKVTEAECQEIRQGVPAALAGLQRAIDRLKSIHDRFADEIASLGCFPSLYLGMVSEEGGLEFYGGPLRIVDSEGNVLADRLDARRYATFLAEAAEPWTYTKFPYYKPMGYPAGMYRVGPLARVNVARFAGTTRADRELRELKQRLAAAPGASFHYHLARLVEALFAVERIEELASEPGLLGGRVRAQAGLNREEGVGACEAPRGMLFHHYKVDPDGRMVWANLLVPTTQNNQAMNRTVEQAARRFVKPRALEEGMLNRVEAGIRCYDPCLSCSTHALGQMPLVVDLVGPGEELLARAERP